MPKMLMGNMPGFDTVATSLMKETFKKKGVATIEELREICIDSGVKLIGCHDDGCMKILNVTDSDIQLFI